MLLGECNFHIAENDVETERWEIEPQNESERESAVHVSIFLQHCCSSDLLDLRTRLWFQKSSTSSVTAR